MSDNPEDIENHARRLIGSTLFTEQSGSLGVDVRAVSICEQVQVIDEYYIAFLQDRHSPTGVELLYSKSGGVEIEMHSKEISREPLPIQDSLDHHIAEKIVDNLEIDKVHGFYGVERNNAINQLCQMYKAFLEMDCTLLEVNPWAMVRSLDTEDCEPYMSVLDTKISIDESALWRQPELRHQREVINA